MVTPPGFTSHRADRSANLSLKSKGGGVCFLINDRWCINSTTVKQFFSPDLELLNVTCRPIYLPREFASVVLIGVYIPPQANANIAASKLALHIATAELSHPDSAVLVLGDFNHCDLSDELPNYIQQVTCPMRGNNILDHCYTKITSAYHSFPSAPKV